MSTQLTQAVVDGLDYLVTLDREGIRPREARGRLRLVERRHPGTRMDLVWEEEPHDGSVHYDVLIRADKQGTVSLSLCRDRALPWPLRGIQRWQEKYLARVNHTVIKVDDAIRLLDVVWQDTKVTAKLVDGCLVAQALDRDPIEVSDAELQRALDAFRRARGLKTEELTHRWMERNGLTHEQLEEILREQVQIAKLRDRVTDGGVEARFDARTAEYATAKIARFECQGQGEASQLAARIRAGAIGFLEAAAERFVERDPGEPLFARVRRSDLDADAAKAIFDSAPGEVVGPLGTATGYALVQVLELRSAQLDDATRAAIRQQLFDEWLAERRREATIEWNWGSEIQTRGRAVTATRPVVFLGPSVDLAEARAVLDADYRPPARKGDVYRCLASRVATIAVIDGVFHTEPSLWQREILDALDEGVHVFGASSMGALRAAELAAHGMVGMGTVFEWYRDGVIDGDDEVALLFGSAEHGYRALSEPLVNIRSSLARAVEEGCITGGQAAELVGFAKRQFYPMRSYRALLAAPEIPRFPTVARQSLELFLRERTVDVKRADALRLLGHLAARRPDHGRAAAKPLGRPVRRERIVDRPIPTSAGPRSGAEVMQALRTQPAVHAPLVAAVHRRCFLLAWAGEHERSCPPGWSQAVVRQFETSRGIDDRGAWLSSRGLTEGEYLRWLEDEAIADWLRSMGPGHFGLADAGDDPDAAFIADWARIMGISAPEGRPLVEWLVQVGPARFGFKRDLLLRIVFELLVTQGADSLAARPGASS